MVLARLVLKYTKSLTNKKLHFNYQIDPITMKKYILPLLLLTAVSTSYAKEKKVQHDAHEHGVAEMNVVWEKDELNIELLSPAYNITGFEHQPSNHDQEELVEKIEKQLNAANQLFGFKGGSCTAKDVKIESPFEDHDDHKEHESHDKHDDHDDHKEHKSHDEHADHKEHDDHDDHKEHDSHDKHSDHDDDHKEHDKHDDHDDHKDHKSHDEHADHDDHKDHANESSTHSEYSMSYSFNCENTKSQLMVETAKLFKHLPQMEKIKVQWLSATSQSSSILTKESNTFTMK